MQKEVAAMQDRLTSRFIAVQQHHIERTIRQPPCSANIRPPCRWSASLLRPNILWNRSRQRSADTPATSSSSSSRDHPVITAKQPEMCVIVDEDNNVIGSATRYETVSNRLLGRGSYVLVFNSAGQLFVTKRSMQKDCYPGCLDVTISGVVNAGKEYADTAARELHEEIGIPLNDVGTRLQQLFIFPYKDNVCHVWGCAFGITWDGPVEFIDKEVEWGTFVRLDELQQQLRNDAEQFTHVGRHILALYLDKRIQQQSVQGVIR